MSLRWFIIHMSIRRKVTLLLLVPCGVVMLLAVTVLFAFQIRMFSEGHHREMSAVADVVSANSTAAVAFNDGASATQILSSLHAISHITGAAIFLPDGTPFATLGQPVGTPMIEVEERYFRQGNDAFMIHPLTLEGKQIGALNIRSNYQAAHAGMVRLMAGMLATILVIGSVVGALLSNWLQKLVSKPILRLTGTAQAVADNNDYSVRASVEPSGELGILTRTFNKMITRIQSQEIALLASQRKLEAILNSIGGVVWEADAATWTVNFVSRPFESMFGYRVDDWLKDRDFWMNIIFSGDRTRVLEVSRQAIAQKKSFLIEYRVRANDGRLVWVRESVSVEVADDRSACLRGLIVDVTEQKAAAENLERLNRRLLEVSRLAGMAEVATGVLHNVGNVLNSVSVSVNLLGDRLQRTRVSNLRRATNLLAEQNGNLATFLTQDRQGKVLPEYLIRLSEFIETEQTEMQSEVRLLTQNVDHIKEIVARQQNYAKVSGVFEQIDPTELVEDTLRINGTAFERHRVTVVRDFAPDLPKVVVDRHKVLQILVNLARNAKQALDASRPDGKILTFRIERTDEGKVAIRVRDNGVGIPPEAINRIFQHGFTTKKDGHGFGLHSGANAAREMGGRLSAHSDGPGCGAEFSLELPIAPKITDVDGNPIPATPVNGLASGGVLAVDAAQTFQI